MLQSFYTGNSGLNANKQWLSVVSDNIANVNTTGFKKERVQFSDLIASSMTSYSVSGTPKNKEIGGGVYFSGTTKDFSQGSFKSTNQPLSLALDGDGFFMVRNPNENITYYTRDGDFRLDGNGDLINPNGMKLLGWRLDAEGHIAGEIGKLTIPNADNPKDTEHINFEDPTNLDSSVDMIATSFNPTDSSTYSYINTMTTYDSLGTAHTLKNFYLKTGINSWRVYTQLDDRNIFYEAQDPTDPTKKIKFSGLQLYFNGKGELTGVDYFERMEDSMKKSAKVVTENSDRGTYTINDNLSVLPGTLFISKITKGGNDVHVQWNDDGQGNVIDVETGEQKGTIDYATGIVKLIGTANDGYGGANSSITVDFYAQHQFKETSDGTYTYPGGSIPKNSLYIYIYDNDSDQTNNIVNAPITDDGNGNLIDNEGNTVGTVNYTNGTITFTDPTYVDGDTQDSIFGVVQQHVPNIADIKTVAINYNMKESRFLNNGANNTALHFDMTKITQLDSDFIFYSKQDGAAKGDLMNTSITDDGVIKATYTNGQIREVGRLAIATFKDKEVLTRKGDNLYIPNQQTFTPIIIPGGVINKIRGGMLEMSNVDVSKEFINLITAQRAYQANAKTITTSDQVLQTTMDIKR